MKTNITPLHDRVIVKRIDEGEQIRGGIIIPDSAKEKPQEGEVIAAGEGKYKEDGTRQPLDVKRGDRVLFGKYSSSEIKIDGEELLIMREDEILGIITRAGAAAGGKKSKEPGDLSCCPGLFVRTQEGFTTEEQRLRRERLVGSSNKQL